MSDLRWILDKLPMGVWVARAPTGQVEYANDAFQEILGVLAAEESVIEDAPATYGIFDCAGRPYPVEGLPFSRVLATGKPVTINDIVIHRPDGRRVNVRAFGTPVLDAGGDVTHVIVAFSDITKEIEVELARDTMEARLALAVNHANIAIWTADNEGVIHLSEGAGLASMGVASGQLVGKNIFQLYADHPSIPDFVRRGLSGESLWYTVEVPGAVYDTYLTPLRDAVGQIVGVAGVSNDVTELRALQTSAIQNDRVIALGTLAASVAHEINNPLTYLLAHLQLGDRTFDRLEQVLAGVEGPRGEEARALLGSVRADLQPVRSAADRIARITGQLRTFSRASEERLELLDLRSVVHAVLELIGKDLAACANLSLDLEAAYVHGDEARLVQVVLNLLVNATHAVQGQKPLESQIAIRTRATADDAVLEVEDSGPGVPVSERGHVFEPFFSTKAIGEGSGLGLFVSRSIVRGMGGDITFGDRPGGGARLHVRLPVHPRVSPRVAREDQGPGESPHVGRAKLLVIDDEPRLLQALRATLEQAGHDVTCVDRSKTALDLLLSPEPFDLIFCDLMMPELTGMELASALRAHASHRLDRVVFMTGGAFTPDARAFVEAHPEQTIDKPFDALTVAAARLSRSRQVADAES